MKLHWIIFALLLGMCAVVGATFFIEEVHVIESPGEDGGPPIKTYLGHGFEHAEFATMDAGGDGAERHENILWFGLAFGLLQIVFFLVCLAFGGRKDGKVGPLVKPIAVAGVVFAAIFTMMVLSYRGYALEETHALFLGLPKPTAWMIYGVWIFPLFYMFLYIFTFDTWTFREEDQARFDRILEEHRAQATDES